MKEENNLEREDKENKHTRTVAGLQLLKAFCFCLHTSKNELSYKKCYTSRLFEYSLLMN